MITITSLKWTISVFCLVFLFNGWFSHYASAQATKAIDTRFKTALKIAGATFSMPEGFRELDSGKDFACLQQEINNTMIYTIGNSENSIRIGFAVLQPLPDVWNERMTALRPEYDSDKVYLAHIMRFADTVNYKVIHYEPAFLTEQYNADSGGEFYRNCTSNYEEKYPYSKIVFIQKNGKGCIEISYFFKDPITHQQIEKIIDDTAGMVRYLN